jgi:hypothetical protein
MMPQSADTACCFCGQTIAHRPPDPVDVVMSIPDGADQGFFAHIACIKRVLHPSVPLYLEHLTTSDDG